MKTPVIRPKSAAEVALWSSTLKAFGYNLKDWVHELARVTSRPALAAAVAEAPPRLKDRFEDGAVADAYLAAYVEFVCRSCKVVPPAWCCEEGLVLEEPWFSDNYPETRADLLVHSPVPFRNRNLFTIPELTVKIRPGRPRRDPESAPTPAARRLRDYRRKINRQLRGG